MGDNPDTKKVPFPGWTGYLSSETTQQKSPLHNEEKTTQILTSDMLIPEAAAWIAASMFRARAVVSLLPGWHNAAPAHIWDSRMADIGSTSSSAEAQTWGDWTTSPMSQKLISKEKFTYRLLQLVWLFPSWFQEIAAARISKGTC